MAATTSPIIRATSARAVSFVVWRAGGRYRTFSSATLNPRAMNSRAPPGARPLRLSISNFAAVAAYGMKHSLLLMFFADIPENGFKIVIYI